MSLWWLSFVDPDRPPGGPQGGNALGVAIVEASTSSLAIRAAWALGCNPGGEALCIEIDPSLIALLSFALPVGRLLDPIDARALSVRIDRELDVELCS